MKKSTIYNLSCSQTQVGTLLGRGGGGGGGKLLKGSEVIANFLSFVFSL